MKKSTTFFTALLLAISSFAQVPQKMSYQAVIRNNESELVINQEVGIRIGILQNDPAGFTVYSETHNVESNENGLLSIEIGTGVTSDVFSDIDWSLGPYFIKTETDPQGGENYSIIGTHQLLSVPYALYAAKAGNVSDTISETDPVFTASPASEIGDDDIAYWNDKVIYTGGEGISVTDREISLEESIGKLDVLTNSEILALDADEGEQLYNVDEGLFQIYDGEKWISVPMNCWPQPTNANAGSDQIFTDGATSTTLMGNTPEQHHGTGEWSILSGEGGNLAETTQPSTTFTGQPCTSYTLQWQITTSCDSSSDDVLIEFHQTPTTAEAGADQLFNDGTTTANLNANAPEPGHGKGEWQIVNGEDGSFADAENPETSFTGQPCSTYELEWQITTVCDTSSDYTKVQFNQTPTIADAGNDQLITDVTTTANLNANIPEQNHGLASWTIVSGEGGNFSDNTNPQTVFSGQLFESYTLRWSIATPCDTSFDDVVIEFYNNGPGEPVIDIDGNSYSTVWIGNQLWMAENLNTTKLNDGTTIPNVTNDSIWDNLTTPGICWYDNDSAMYADPYGALYNWYAVETEKLCPQGWHVPSDEEWTELADYLTDNGYGYEGSGDDIAKALASKEYWYWESDLKYPSITDDGAPLKNPEMNNASGFTGIPNGSYRADTKYFFRMNIHAYWWSATEGDGYAWGRSILNYNAYFFKNGLNKKSGIGVRCLRD